jgi:hypothetical protein
MLLGAARTEIAGGVGRSVICVRSPPAAGVTTQLGDARFAFFATSFFKSRRNFPAILRVGDDDYVVNEDALGHMRAHGLTEPVIDAFAAHPTKHFADRPAWQALLEALGLTRLEVTPDPVKIATEGALWGGIRHHGLLDGTVIVSDDASQFRIGRHALRWCMLSAWCTS